ncbi:MAG: hypothetical protein JWQ11_4886 [Rhizobacter sp.]|nr:hypothetical protein [Rhizobacter sp.]
MAACCHSALCCRLRVKSASALRRTRSLFEIRRHFSRASIHTVRFFKAMHSSIHYSLKLRLSLRDTHGRFPSDSIEPVGNGSAPHMKISFVFDGHRFSGEFHLQDGRTTIPSHTSRNEGAFARIQTTDLLHISAGTLADLSARNCVSQAAVRRIKPGLEPAIVAWRCALTSVADQARESILREGVLSEHWYCFHFEDATYLVALMVRGTASEMLYPRLAGDLAVDGFHKKFKSSWDRDFRCECTLR